MTILIDRVVGGGAWCGSHISKFEIFFDMPLGLNMPICNQKSHPAQAVECLIFSIVFSKVTSMESLQYSTARVRCDFFLLALNKI